MIKETVKDAENRMKGAIQSLEEDLARATRVLADLESLGISMDEVTYELEVEGVKTFADAFTVLLDAVKEKTGAVVG